MSSVQCGGHTSQQNSGCSAHHSLLKQNTGANHGADLGRMFSVQRAVLCLVGPKHSVAVPSAQPTLVGQSMLQPAQSHLCPPTALGHVGKHHLPKPGQPHGAASEHTEATAAAALHMCSSQVCAAAAWCRLGSLKNCFSSGY